MENKFVKYFKVENFKCFESFEMDNIGQFNLILGDNNVGKTSLLEALTINQSALFFRDCFHTIFLAVENQHEFSYENIIYLKRLFKNFDINKPIKVIFDDDKLEIHLKGFEKLNSDELKIFQEQAFIHKVNAIKHLISIYKNGKLFDLMPINTPISYVTHPYIMQGRAYNNMLAMFYNANIVKDKMLNKQLIDALKIILPDIADIKSTTIDNTNITTLLIETKAENYLKPISSYGDGFYKVFETILLLLCQGNNSKLFIDEIDAGIHHTHFVEFCKAILLICKEKEIQLFATTHNEEFIKYYLEALQDDDLKHLQNEARCIRLRSTKIIENDEIKSSTVADVFDFEQFEFAMLNENEVRG